MKKAISCICLLLVLFSCKNGPTGSPKNTVTSFIEASKDGDFEKIKQYISHADLSMIQMGESFMAKADPNAMKEMKEKMAGEFKSKSKDAKYEIKDEKIDGSNATVNVEFNYNGKTETRPLSLVKEDGQWKISLISTGMSNAGEHKADVEAAMKSINLDSMKKSVEEGMAEYNKLDKDSLNKVMQEGMKELEKLKDTPGNNK